MMIAAGKKAKPRKIGKEHSKGKTVSERHRKRFKRADGSYMKFYDKAAVILGDEKERKGTRILGPIAKEIKEKGFTTIAMMANDLL